MDEARDEGARRERRERDEFEGFAAPERLGDDRRDTDDDADAIEDSSGEPDAEADAEAPRQPEDHASGGDADDAAGGWDDGDRGGARGVSDAGASVAAQAVAADTRPPDRAERAGYPPDHGPEQPVLKVRPAFFRPHALAVLGLLFGTALTALTVWWVAGDEHGPRLAAWTAAVLGGAAIAFIAGWWAVARYSYMLEVTNKRSVEHIGLFSKTTDEVLHDHVRNVTIEQSFYDRVVNVGRLGIASAGHGETEINMDDVPRPKRVREVIDLYRPVG